MKIYEEKRLQNFEFWSGAADNAATLSNRDLDNLECIIEDLYPDGIDATTLNDLLWFDFDTVKEWLGIEDEEEEEEKEEEEEEDE